MKVIGMLGGMSWESSLEYYRIINQEISGRLGGLSSARILMYSVDFGPMAALLMDGNWDQLGRELAGWARRLERAGADCVVIATNTMHQLAPQVAQAVRIPLLHIADAVGRAVREKGMDKVGLLGTKFTMELDFYRERLQERYGIEVIIPDADEREMINQVVFQELCLGRIEDSSRRRYLKAMEGLARQGAQGMILGCTEIPLLVKPEHTELELFDTTLIHAGAAVEFALAD